MTTDQVLERDQRPQPSALKTSKQLIQDDGVPVSTCGPVGIIVNYLRKDLNPSLKESIIVPLNPWAFLEIGTHIYWWTTSIDLQGRLVEFKAAFFLMKAKPEGRGFWDISWLLLFFILPFVLIIDWRTFPRSTWAEN